MSQPQITSDWAPADSTPNRLEVALTDQIVSGHGGNGQQKLIALRDTHSPGTVLYMTPGQLRSFTRQASESNSPVGRVLAEASSR